MSKRDEDVFKESVNSGNFIKNEDNAPTPIMKIKGSEKSCKFDISYK